MLYTDEKDYIMRMIKEMVRVLFSLAFGKKFVSVELERENKYEVAGNPLEDLMRMVDLGQINEAENLLLDGLDREDQAYFEMALMFYERLGRKSEEFLALHDYSGQEVVDGLRYVAEYYGYGNLFDLLSEDKGDD